MSSHRTKSLLAAWMLVLLAAVPAFGAHPLGIRDMGMFAPADLSTYGGGYRPNEGFFFSFDGLIWWIRKPDRALIGDPTTRRVVLSEQIADADADGVVDPGFVPQKAIEFSTLDTSDLNSEAVGGTRYDCGYVDGQNGWLFSGFTLHDQNQTIHASDVHVVFQDAPFDDPPRYHLQGYIDPDLLVVDDLPVRFDEFEVHNQVNTWGLELNYLRRMRPLLPGGILELFLGARYLEFDETFDVTALEYVADPTAPLALGLGDSFWNTEADNHIVGPQIGGRWFRKTGRWTCSTEARFFAGFNSQTVRLQGGLGSNLDPVAVDTLPQTLAIRNMTRTSVSHNRDFDEWSPAAELRVDLKYQLTRAISAGVGWSGIWIDGIARASDMIDYSLGQNNAMGINDRNRQEVFMHGLTIRVELNR